MPQPLYKTNGFDTDNYIRIVWPQIMGTGARFSDISNPVVMVKVGNEGDVGSVEISDLLFTVRFVALHYHFRQYI